MTDRGCSGSNQAKTIVSRRCDEIVIVRHGPSSHPLTNRRLTSGEFRDWIDAYNRAPVLPDRPPADLARVAAQARCIVCSDLPRSVTSAHLLCGPDGRVHASSLFREAGRPIDWDCLVRLPLGTWDRASVLLWRAGCSFGGESFHLARVRGRIAAAQLALLATEFGMVVCVGHGTFNAIVADALRRERWTGSDRLDSKHWGSSTFRRASQVLRPSHLNRDVAPRGTVPGCFVAQGHHSL